MMVTQINSDKIKTYIIIFKIDFHHFFCVILAAREAMVNHEISGEKRSGTISGNEAMRQTETKPESSYIKIHAVEHKTKSAWPGTTKSIQSQKEQNTERQS